MSEEAVSNRNHAERIAYLQRQIKTLERKQDASFLPIIILIGSSLALSLFASIEGRGIFGLNFTVEASLILLGVALVVLGYYVYRHYASLLEPLKKEIAQIATRRDWLRDELLVGKKKVSEHALSAEKKTFEIQGQNIHDIETFYDEIQRVLCPQCGFFGRNLDALEDILRGGFGTFDFGESIRVIVHHPETIKKAVGSDKYDIIVEIFANHPHIEIIYADSS